MRRVGYPARLIFFALCLAAPERFPAKRTPVRVKKTRQIKNREPRSDSIGTDKALAAWGKARSIARYDDPLRRFALRLPRGSLHRLID